MTEIDGYEVLGLGLYYEDLPVGRKFRTIGRTLTEADLMNFISVTGLTEVLFSNIEFLREESDKPIVLLASGTGFAPIKALIEQMHHLGSIRPVRLYWGARKLSDIYLADWIAEAKQLLPQLEYVPVLSDAAPEDAWTGRTGFVHQAVMADLHDLSGHQVYACGAPVMVESAQRDFVAQCGLPGDEFYADSFTSEADKHGA